MPHLDTVIEARDRAEQFISNIGNDLDSNKEHEDEGAMEQGEQEHPYMAVKDPSGLFNDDHDLTSGDRTFRRIDLQNKGKVYSQTRCCRNGKEHTITILLTTQNWSKSHANIQYRCGRQPN